MLEAFSDQRFYSKSRAILVKSTEICTELRAEGYDISLRQLFYALVSRGVIPNTIQDYSNLGNLIRDARVAGVFDWDFIVDRNRTLQGVAHWRDPSSIIQAAASSFRLDKWADQDYRVEVWVEKDALSGVIARPSELADVDYFACKGYVSISEMYVAAKRHNRYEAAGQEVVVLHFGDHDPSGLDMTRDIQDRLELLGSSATVERLALNMDQVRTMNPPPNPVKLDDVRAKGYIEEHGRESWELDAIPPRDLAVLVTEGVERYLDRPKFERLVAKERRERDALEAVSEEWEKVIEFADLGFEIPEDDARRLLEELARLAADTADTTRAKALRAAILKAAGE